MWNSMCDGALGFSYIYSQLFLFYYCTNDGIWKTNRSCMHTVSMSENHVLPSSKRWNYQTSNECHCDDLVYRVY